MAFPQPLTAEVKEPGCKGALIGGKGVLFIPRLAKVYETWMGPIKGPEWFLATYEVDECYYLDEVAATLRGRGVRDRRQLANELFIQPGETARHDRRRPDGV